jgi:hypothetical protein
MSQGPETRRDDRQVRFGRILGLSFCVSGFTAIGFGWNGSAKSAFVDVQFPYLISGGIGGAALVLLGIGLLVMAQIRVERIKLTAQMEQLASVVGRVTAVAGAGTSANGRVVAGKATYHRPDCRLIEGKRDLNHVSAEAAKLSGLSPCRVCDPADPDVTRRATSTAPFPARTDGVTPGAGSPDPFGAWARSRSTSEAGASRS